MDEEVKKRPRKLTVLAYGEGEDEKIFLRHLVSCYCRKHEVSVQTGSAGGGDLESILIKAIRARRGEKREIEFIVLDTIPQWPAEAIQKAEEEGINLMGNTPCLESFFLEILGSKYTCDKLGAGSCKNLFEENYCSGHNFDEDNCATIFPKALLNEARTRVPNLDYIIKTMEGSSPNAGGPI